MLNQPFNWSSLLVHPKISWHFCDELSKAKNQIGPRGFYNIVPHKQDCTLFYLAEAVIVQGFGIILQTGRGQILFFGT